MTDWIRFGCAVVTRLLGVLVLTSIVSANADESGYSQPAANDVPRQVFWGDTHLHTRLSADAFSKKGYTLGPEEAYRFARGETITAWNGNKIKLRRPLDFLVVTDHGQYLGIFAGIQDGDESLLATKTGALWRSYLNSDQASKIKAEFLKIVMGLPSANDNDEGSIPAEVTKSIWQSVGERADRYNDPGHFTAFIGYEYTSMPNVQNLHRNVIFRDGAEVTSRQLPFTAGDSLNPEDLWTALADYEKNTGGSVLAIPHNGNTSNGLMFDTRTFNGEPLSTAYARTRSRWEPLYEVTQIKGDSETHPILSPTDEFADYETWNSWFGPSYEGVKTAGWEKRKASEYARSALKLGLKFEDELGANPFKFGLVGSTDSHTALATAEEDNFWGKFSEPGIPTPDRWKRGFSEKDVAKDVAEDHSSQSWILGASGLAAIWARENNRESLFDAMQRREVYATTGSRITVRFFGGWDYPIDADARPDYVDIGYKGGVPMGGDLAAAPTGKAPVFIVVAAKDPDEANLDRIQIIKGWLDKDRHLHEKVYDVAWSDGRTPGPETDKLPPVGSTVDFKNASYTNTIGEAVLSVTWRDPDFDPAQRAFYYARVLEIPKPRWTTYDAAFFKSELPPANIPSTTQDRAYTSPIWYTP